MARYAKLWIVCGRRQTGKTNTTLTQIFTAVKERKRKALIFDPTGEFGSYIYRADKPALSIRPIFLKDVARFSGQARAEIVRIKPLNDNGVAMSLKDKQKALSHIQSVYRNGILLAEDTNKYIDSNPTLDIIGALATLRQNGVDTIFQYQLVQKAANPKLMGMANYVRLHKTNDQVESFAEGFQDRIDIMCLAQTIVNNRYEWGLQNNKQDDTGMYFHVLIDFDFNKIRGIFMKSEAQRAIEEFISRNSSITINREMQRRDRNGKKIWSDYASAYSYLEQKMMADYFLF